MINHSKSPNVIQQMITPDVTFVLSTRGISEGEEIFIDYVQGITEQVARNEALNRWGIKEEDDGSVSQQEIKKVSKEEIEKSELEEAAERKAAV